MILLHSGKRWIYTIVSYNRSTLVLAAIIILCSPVHVLYFVTFCDFLLLDIHCLIILIHWLRNAHSTAAIFLCIVKGQAYCPYLLYKSEDVLQTITFNNVDGYGGKGHGVGRRGKSPTSNRQSNDVQEPGFGYHVIRWSLCQSGRSLHVARGECFIMVALWNRADHYIFMLFLLLSSFFISSPNLSGRRLDVYHTSTHGVALVWI